MSLHTGRGWRRLVLVLALAGFAVVAAAFVYLYFGTRPPAGRPNVLLITIDTLRWDHLGCYGDANARTPVLDALAARGVRFPLAVAHVPLTLPSHASIMTGTTPLRHGVRNNVDFVLGPSPTTLAERFRAAGYRTGAFVSGYPVSRRLGLDRGFDEYDDRFPRGTDPTQLPYVERRADETAARLIGWLATGDGEQAPPFFAWLHLFDPHAPYDPPEPFRSAFAGRPYDGEIAFADRQVGVVLDALRQRGLLARTIVLATSDHGEGLGDHDEPTHGLFIYDSTIRVPFIVAGPGVPEGRTVDGLAQGIDVAPTLLDLARLVPLPAAEGRSLVPAWDALVQGAGRPAGGRRGDTERQIGAASEAAETAYVESLFARLSFGWAPLAGWRARATLFIDAPEPELYDLRDDPGQQRNVAQGRPADVERFQGLLRAAQSKAVEEERTPSSADARARLESLGYVSSGPIRAPSLRNPRALAPLATRIEQAMALVQADPTKAVTEFRAILQADPANPLARRQLAMALATGRRYDEAIGELNRLAADGNAGAESMALLADCYRLSGRAELALEAARAAGARDPRMPEAPNAAGKALVALGRRQEARAEFERALALAPDNPEALAALVDLALERGDATEARTRLERLRARDPGDLATALKLGVVLVRAGELEPAIALFREVVARDPSNVEALVDLGGALAKAGRPAEAVPLLERAVTGGATTPTVLNSLGFARLETGNQRGAADALRRSLRVKPDQPNILAVLEKLEGR